MTNQPKAQCLKTAVIYYYSSCVCGSSGGRMILAGLSHVSAVDWWARWTRVWLQLLSWGCSAAHVSQPLPGTLRPTQACSLPGNSRSTRGKIYIQAPLRPRRTLTFPSFFNQSKSHGIGKYTLPLQQKLQSPVKEE